MDGFEESLSGIQEEIGGLIEQIETGIDELQTEVGEHQTALTDGISELEVEGSLSVRSELDPLKQEVIVAGNVMATAGVIIEERVS